MNKIIVLSASSDIGGYLVEHYLREGNEVIGTYRTWSNELARLKSAGARLIQLDISSKEQIASFERDYSEIWSGWDILISAPGQLFPIGDFFSTNFDEWESSVITNSTAQLRFLHAIYSGRSSSLPIKKIIFFAGGGTNSSFDNYSAYCLGKISLIKMTELLDSEYSDLQISIIGTGWVNTKIHHQTLMAGILAGQNYQKTQLFIESSNSNSNSNGATLRDVSECIDWCLSAPREAVSGRNFSLIHDPWRESEFIEQLIADPNFCKLRRFFG